MIQRIKQILADKLIKNIIWGHLFILIFYLVLLFWKWSSLPSQIPLFYSLPKGEEQLGNNFQIILIPFFSLLIFGLNLFLSSLYYAKERLVSILLLSISFVSSILFLITFIKIVFLIT